MLERYTWLGQTLLLLPFLCTVLLVAGKLSHAIDLHWAWVLSPLWLPVLGAVGTMAWVMILAAFIR
jgi:hypothetical protein